MTNSARWTKVPDSPSIGSGASRAARVPELDSLRGLGALTILGYHLWPATLFLGWTRADLFFVLSGYLITSIILRHGSRPHFLFRFWARRALRIWPAYYLLLAILCALAISTGFPPSRDGLIAHLTFTQNFPQYWGGIVPKFPDGAIQTWSLAIEEQFYLLWPLIIVLTGRSGVVPVALGLLISSVGSRMLGWYPTIALARLDGLALGAILSVILEDGKRSRPRSIWLSLAFLTIGLASLVFLSGYANKIETPIPGIAGCGAFGIFAVNTFFFSVVGLVICHTGHPTLRLLRNRTLCYLGQISYGIFLYHLIVIDAVSAYLRVRTIATDMVSVLLSLLIAVLSWEWIERPIGNLKELFPYEANRPKQPTAPEESAILDEGCKGDPAARLQPSTPFDIYRFTFDRKTW
jgi:peptidoglycan/LPS O-acetylase OafA/YrhL